MKRGIYVTIGLILSLISGCNSIQPAEVQGSRKAVILTQEHGWAWLLKLAEELHTWNDPLARELEQNLIQLTELIVERYLAFLPKLV